MNPKDTLNSILKKNWQDRELSDIMQGSPAILKGIDAKTAKMLEDHFGIKSILEMARNKHFLFAQMLEVLSLQDGAVRHKIQDSGFMRKQDLIEA